MADDRIEEIEERLLILRDKAAREGFDVPDDVLDYIAQKYAVPQTLKGAVINVCAYAQRRGIPVDMDVARLVLDGIRPASVVDQPVADAAEEEAADTFGTAAAEGFQNEGFEAPGSTATDAEPRVAEGSSSPDTQQPGPHAPTERSLEDALSAVLDATVVGEAHAPVSHEPLASLFDETEAPAAEPAAAPEPAVIPESEPAVVSTPEPAVAPAFEPSVAPAAAHPDVPVPEPTQTPVTSTWGASAPGPEPALVWFSPVRTSKKESLVTRAGRLLQRAGIDDAIEEGDLVAIKLHFGEEGNTGFVSPVFLREVVRLVREAGGKPFLTDANTLYRGKRANAVDHIACAVHNGFTYATVEAPVIIADGLDGRDAVDVPISGFDHFDSVRIASAAVHADAMVVVTHVKGHEATGMGGALKNVGMGLGCRSAKQRMHSDLKPQVNGEKCTACGRCVKWCPVDAIAITPDRVARIDYELCYGCGECVAACPYGAIAIQWKTEPDAIQEKIVEHAAGAVAGKEGKVLYLSFVMDISPDCDCWHFSDASVVSDIGVLASTDIVAIDQAAFDLVKQASGLSGTRGEGLKPGADKFAAITGVDCTVGLAYAERHGLGTRRYELRTLD